MKPIYQGYGFMTEALTEVVIFYFEKTELQNIDRKTEIQSF